MTQQSKEDTSRHFKQRLEQIQCPLVDGVDESWITELIFTPGEPRIRLLQWLFTRFDSRLNEVIEPNFSSSSKLDSRLQRILFVASTLGLCGPNDADLIKGSTSVGKQTSFMRHILDLIYMDTISTETPDRSSNSPGVVGPGVSLRQQFREDCVYVDVLADEVPMDKLFTEHTKLLPPDIDGLLQRRHQECRDYGEQPSNVPTYADMQVQLQQCADEIRKQQDTLEELKKQYEFQEPLQSSVHIAANESRMRVGLNELHQLLRSFSYTYQTQLLAWCNRQQPQTTPLGSDFQRVHVALTDFTALLRSMDIIHENHVQLCGPIRERLEQLRYKQMQRSGTTNSYTNSEIVTEYVNIMKESLKRIQDVVDHPVHESILQSHLHVALVPSDRIYCVT